MGRGVWVDGWVYVCLHIIQDKSFFFFSFLHPSLPKTSRVYVLMRASMQHTIRHQPACSRKPTDLIDIHN